MSYDNRIIDTLKESARPLRHREIAERIEPGSRRAWNNIGMALTKLYRAGALRRQKLDGRYWHYSIREDPPILQVLREQLAALEHSQWSQWMEYQFDKGTFNSDGTWTMPAWAVERWQRQMRTPYADLPEGEKESDREEADKVLQVILKECHS